MLAFMSHGVRSAPSEGAYEQASPKAIGEWADAEFLPALADKRFSGLVITVVRAGEAPFSRGYGHANAMTGAPVLPQETLFRIGSATKVFTATAVAQLLEQTLLEETKTDEALTQLAETMVNAKGKTKAA